MADPTAFSEHLDAHLASYGPADVQRLSLAAVDALGRRLHAFEKRPLMRSLPPRLAEAFYRSGYEGPLALEEVHARMGRETGLGPAAAAEGLAAVARALAEVLDPETRSGLQRRLPDAYARLLELDRHHEPPRAGSGLVRESPAPSGRTLAEGRPGSSRPLSETHPRSGQQGSVAAWEDDSHPSEMAGARGVSSDHPLSDSAPGSEHPVSEATEDSRRDGEP